MSTKLERIKNMEDELAKLKEQVEEEEKVVEPEIKVGCVVRCEYGDRLLAKVSGLFIMLPLTVVDNFYGIYCHSIRSGNSIKNCIDTLPCTFLAPSLEEYYKQKGGCCGKCKKEE